MCSPQGRARVKWFPLWLPKLTSPQSPLVPPLDFCGDVTIALKSGEKVEAYIFNRNTGRTPADSWAQYLAPNVPGKCKLGYDQIARLEFTGKDRAAGKHWEDWVKAYNEKKAAGEKNIALHPEALE